MGFLRLGSPPYSVLFLSPTPPPAIPEQQKTTRVLAVNKQPINVLLVSRRGNKTARQTSAPVLNVQLKLGSTRCISLLFLLPLVTFERGRWLQQRSPCPNFYCPRLAVTSMWRCFATLPSGSQEVSGASGSFCLGRKKTPEPG